MNRCLSTNSPERMFGICLAFAVALLTPSGASSQHHDTAPRAGLQQLTFARHVDALFSLAAAQTAMANATTVIQACDGTPNTDEDVACQVTMQVNGTVGTFGVTGDGGDVITTGAEMSALINSGTADVMVVTAITYCNGTAGPGLTIIGCGNIGSKGIVSVNTLPGNELGVEITHEFLHNKGHKHRGDAGEGPQTPGAILNPVLTLTSNIINQAECASLHSGAADNGPIIDPPPTIHCPGNVTVECAATGGTPVTDPSIQSFLQGVTADDVCEPAPTVTNNAPAFFSHAGSVPVTFTATDAGGNVATCTAYVTVVDTKAPTIACPANVVVGTDPGQCGAAVTYPPPVVSDICAQANEITVSCTPPSASFFPKGTTSVNCTATDPSANRSSCSFSVTVQDREQPQIVCPANITVNNDPGLCSAVLNYTVTATDNCPGVSISCDHTTGSTFPVGTTPVNCTATDASANTASCSFTITVIDNEPPKISISLSPKILWPPNHSLRDIAATVAVSDNCPGVTFVLTSITDNEPDNGLGDGNTTNDIQNASYGTPALSFRLRSERSGTGDGRDYVVTYTATDAHGNSARASDTVSVPHNQPAAALLESGIAEDRRVLVPLLHRNYPNPFNPSTVIPFDIPSPSRVSLVIYNMLGTKIRELVDGEWAGGSYEVSWDGLNEEGLTAPTGIYLCRFSAIPTDGTRPYVRSMKVLMMK